MAHTIAQYGIDGHAEGVGYVHKILYKTVTEMLSVIRRDDNGAGE